MRRYIFLSVLLVLLLGAGCAPGYSGSDASPKEDSKQEIIKIGAIQALTGNEAVHGLRAKKGIDLALKHLNEQGILKNKKIEIIYEDDKCNTTDGVAAATRLINVEKVAAILGPQCSGVAMAAAPIIEQSKTVMISSIASVPDLRNSGDYIFRNRIAGDLQGIQIAEFAYRELKSRTAAILYINIDNGIGYRDAFKRRFEELGGKIVASEAWEKDATDFRTQLTKIKQQNPDALYIAGQSAEQAFKQIGELGIKTKLLTINGFEGPDILKVAADAADGTYYSYSAYDTSSTEPLVSAFQKAYFDAYGEGTHEFSANAYDAMMLLGLAIKDCSSDSDCIKDYLYKVKNYPGVSGETSFDSFGEVSKPMMIKQLKAGRFIKVQ